MRSLVVLLTLAVATTTNCAEIASRDLVEAEGAALPADGVSQRDDKCKSKISLVEFSNVLCFLRFVKG